MRHKLNLFLLMAVMFLSISCKDTQAPTGLIPFVHIAEKLKGTEWLMTKGVLEGELLMFGFKRDLWIVLPGGRDTLFSEQYWVFDGVMFVQDTSNRSVSRQILGEQPWHLSLSEDDTVLEIRNNPPLPGGETTFRGRYEMQRRISAGR
jgi:hypothetical protein